MSNKFLYVVHKDYGSMGIDEPCYCTDDQVMLEAFLKGFNTFGGHRLKVYQYNLETFEWNEL